MSVIKYYPCLSNGLITTNLLMVLYNIRASPFSHCSHLVAIVGLSKCMPRLSVEVGSVGIVLSRVPGYV